MVVVDEAENPASELTVPEAQRVDPDVEVGDELGFQVFYREGRHGPCGRKTRSSEIF